MFALMIRKEWERRETTESFKGPNIIKISEKFGNEVLRWECEHKVVPTYASMWSPLKWAEITAIKVTGEKGEEMFKMSEIWVNNDLGQQWG